MEIELYDPMNKDIEDKPICNSDELPEREDEQAAYFPSVYDKKEQGQHFGCVLAYYQTVM
jgi:hypothetical protein